jgi:hypothetical protein
MHKIVNFIVAGSLLTLATACSSNNVEKSLRDNASFWQRANASEAAYQQGPKVQQMLHRDIARCTAELRELHQLGVIRQNIPAEYPYGGPEDMARWETPARTGYLLNEHGNYHDFETCMIEKGWERIEHVPYDTALKSRQNYMNTVYGERFQSKHAKPEPMFVEKGGKKTYANSND